MISEITTAQIAIAEITISPFHLQAVAETSATHIAECLVGGTLIALVAGLTSRLVRGQSSSVRFAVWFSSLMAIAALPLLSSMNALRGVRSLAAGPSAITLPSAWALYLFATWAVISACLLARVGVSLFRVRALRKGCVPVDSGQVNAHLHEMLKSTARPVALCTSDQVQVPTAIGFFHPAVVIPAWLLDDLSPEELHQIVLHELAHLRRRDDWTNLIQQIVKALFFFHPAVWWIEKKISLEREMACDEAVLAATEKPRAYAECLTHLAERTFIRRTVALAQAALGRVRHTSLRVAQILNPNRPSGTRHSPKTAMLLIAIFAVGSAVVASREPRLIAFQDSAAHQTSRDHSSIEATSTAEHAAVAIDSSVSASLKPIRASFPIPQATATKKVRRKLPPAPGPVNVATAPSAPAQNVDGAFFALVIESESNAPSVVRQVNFTAPLVTQTFFLIVQEPESLSNQPTYQIFWRITVFHPAQPAAAKIPNKET